MAQYDPDIVLFQESPSQSEIEELARELFGDGGEAVWSHDTSILARGRVELRSGEPSSHFVHALVTSPSGFEVEVVSLRLKPPVSRLDFWSPGFWRDHRENRIKHRRQVQEVVAVLEEAATTTDLIVGGDFNAPAGNGALTPLRPAFFDTFHMAGRGWGNTGTNRFPLFRVDQIWTGGGFRVESVTARKTDHSDHRLVVCDLVVGELPAERRLETKPSLNSCESSY